MALGVLGGGISVSADEDVPTIVIYNNSGAFSVAGAEAGSDSSIYQKMQDYILEQTGVKVEIIMPPSDAGAQTENSTFCWQAAIRSMPGGETGEIMRKTASSFR